MSRQFQRTVEDFECGNCGAQVTGTGYTNHCPACLWSRHVDVQPGDRAAQCQALMRPVRAHLDHGAFIITHECTRCGVRKLNKAARSDDRDLLIALSATGWDQLPR
ncbi:MAG: RNHCP domain-containing protein [Corynebacteriales bacterium]|nr:RNHCP domain-containing protein [Mycobacteriales bacterium]